MKSTSRLSIAKRWDRFGGDHRWAMTMVLMWLVAVSIRWYRLPDWLFFGFEQGRDAQIIMNISRLQDVVLVGPKTDIAGIFHGAWYYYAMVIPYVLGKGNPLVASLGLIALTGLVPVVVADLTRRVTLQMKWGIVAGVLAVVSFEAIQYSRWLSNVTPALLGVPVVFWLLWRCKETKQPLWWWLAAATAGLTAQFEIILTLWWVWVVAVLMISNWLPRLPWRTWLLGMALAAMWYVPWVVFNARNEWISFRSVWVYLHEGQQSAGSAIALTVLHYWEQLFDVLGKNLTNGAPGLTLAVAVITVGGVLVGWGRGARAAAPRIQRWHHAVWLALTWVTMSLPVVLFPRSLDLPQLYVGTGVGMIWLVVLALVGWWYWQPKLGAAWGVVLLLILAISLRTNVYRLATNQAVFFRTIQDDLNLRDQRAVLGYIHSSAVPSYRWTAFTIPYFQAEGWKYLDTYYFPERQANLTAPKQAEIYLIIEEKVDPFWRQKWTEEEGSTKLVETKTFGLLTVERRLYVPATSEGQ